MLKLTIDSVGISQVVPISEFEDYLDIEQQLPANS